MDDKLKSLVLLLAQGWPIFPIEPGGKRPLTDHGYLDASIDPKIVKGWHSRWPAANWAIATGAANLAVIDLDTHQANGFDSWEMVRTEHPDSIETVQVKTGGNGLHIYFAVPPSHVIRSRTEVWPGIDCKSAGGYVLAPPSITQKSYEWEFSPNDVKLQMIPDWLLAVLDGHPKKERVVTSSKKLPQSIPEGTRNDRLFRLACSFRRKDLTEAEIEAAVSAVNQRCDPPLPEEEVKAIVASTAKYTSGMPDTTDVANAYRFENLYRGQVRFCKGLDTWLIWDGKRWCKDDTYQVIELALKVADVIRDEAEAATDPSARQLLAKGWVAAKDVWNIESFLRLARSLLAIRPEELDKATGYLNVVNGILNMATGELTPHDPSRYITKLLPVEYHWTDECPNWDAFLAERVPKQENREYLQRIIGYALSGRSDGKRVPFIFGSPDTGKSTFLETIKQVAGDYCQKTSIELILASRYGGSGEGPTPLLRQLFGARMVIASEIPKGRTVNDGIFKDLSGGDSFIARGLHEAPVTDRPTHCLVLYGNEKPKFKDLSGATANRIAIVGFNVIIPPEARKDMLDVIAIFMEERSGILNWIVQGYMNYLEDGLRDTVDVAAARREYETEQDVIQRFLGERCEFHDDHTILKVDLYNNYKDWCKESNENPESRAAFTREIVKKGYELCGHGRNQFRGLKLSSFQVESDQEDEDEA